MNVQLPVGTWRLAHRPIEGGPWSTVVRGTRPRDLATAVARGARLWGPDVRPGDLVGAFDAAEALVDLYGVRDDLSLGCLPRPASTPGGAWAFDPACAAWVRGRTWPEAWARCLDARWLLHAAGGIAPRPELVRAAGAVARTVFCLLPEHDPRPREAVEAVEAWARGETPREAVEQAARGAGEAVALALAVAVSSPWERCAEAWAAARAADAAQAVATLPWATAPGTVAASVAGWVASACATDPSTAAPDPEALARLAGLVRRALPLGDVVVWLLGVPG